MAVFEFRRHSIKDGDPKGTIGPKGKLFARAVGERQMQNKKFDRYCISTVPRTKQTLEAIADGAGWSDIEEKTSFAHIYLVSPELQEMWRVCHAAEKRGEDMVAAASSHDTELVRRTSVEVAQLFRTWARTLPREERVLVIGHSPHLEFLALGLTGLKMPGLKECQGFRIHASVLPDGFSVKCSLVHLTNDLDPTELRRTLFEGM